MDSHRLFHFMAQSMVSEVCDQKWASNITSITPLWWHNSPVAPQQQHTLLSIQKALPGHQSVEKNGLFFGARPSLQNTLLLPVLLSSLTLVTTFTPFLLASWEEKKGWKWGTRVRLYSWIERRRIVWDSPFPMRRSHCQEWDSIHTLKWVVWPNAYLFPRTQRQIGLPAKLIPLFFFTHSKDSTQSFTLFPKWT